MKKLLKADQIKAFVAASTVEYPKEDYEQLIVSVQVNVAAWVTGTSYVADDLVTNGGKVYKCITNHTASAAFATDAAKWEVLASVNVVVKNDAGVTLKTEAVALDAATLYHFQVDLVAFDEKFSVTFPASVKVVAILGDKRDIDVADVEKLPIPAKINPVISL